MPELPEVETTRRGIAAWLEGVTPSEVRIHNPSLRWPIPPELPQRLIGRPITNVGRRAKYLLLHNERGTALVHLGMSGSLRLSQPDEARRTHDHVEIPLAERILRFNDPRRFGAWLWSTDPPQHPLLAPLGPEPLGTAFDGDHLYHRSRGRRASVKAFIMDAKIVVGVGNIYAAEALFMAGIHPQRPAGRVGRTRYRRLADAIQQVLMNAIELGGTTLRDFTDSQGNPGYFRQSLAVYGRESEPCHRCGQPLRHRVIGQRSTVFCARCQR
ncbi:bifunctional DNA-formamidopyrimidine glycosylase/DNA-(apurinic or apyrimidinic site) lyase [Salicola sp. Rm-C-2C1-2]|uniref:bifunctional DNA-formamidopyrimidine glycosylase/DNA-(apurinic or apyrimidinic site) lyase n=1 Tax=Salicola sp. Rm-C-2C1-2 TaxID=3141321 RepID=UPI0032E4E7FD